MGDSVSCCNQASTDRLSMREIVCLEDSVACKQWMEGRDTLTIDFLKGHYRIKEIYSKKPTYCYKIDRNQLT